MNFWCFSGRLLWCLLWNVKFFLETYVLVFLLFWLLKHKLKILFGESSTWSLLAKELAVSWGRGTHSLVEGERARPGSGVRGVTHTQSGRPELRCERGCSDLTWSARSGRGRFSLRGPRYGSPRLWEVLVVATDIQILASGLIFHSESMSEGPESFHRVFLTPNNQNSLESYNRWFSTASLFSFPLCECVGVGRTSSSEPGC